MTQTDLPPALSREIERKKELEGDPPRGSCPLGPPPKKALLVLMSPGADTDFSALSLYLSPPLKSPFQADGKAPWGTLVQDGLSWDCEQESPEVPWHSVGA